MTGSGAVIYSSGNFAVGNATNNITYNGTSITLNGTVVFPSNINSNNLTLKDGSGNVILGNGTPLNYANITPASGWLNSNITISAGAISGIGTGSGTVVDNSSIYISSGNIYGIGSGAGTPVANSLISLGTLGAGAFAYINSITTANVSTYIGSAAIGTAQVGVLAAGNIGANTIDASKIAANTITAGQIAANTITASQIAASTITADRMNISNLSAITANLGTITAGSISGTSLSVGTTPAVSGTSMTGAGAVINTGGTFALGNSSTNISYNGSAMYLNGNVVATANVNSNAITNVVYASSASSFYVSSYTTWANVLSVSITSTGGPLLITTNGNQIVGSDSTYPNPVAPLFRLVRGSTVLVTKQIPSGTGVYGSCDASISYAETPASGTYTYYLQFIASTYNDTSPGVSIPFISVTELKR
jgi:hypothetical protein